MEGDHFQFSLGPPNSGFSMFLADRTKKVHFIRHAEGFHNVASRETGSNECLSDMALWDARLTPAGIEQCKTLRAELAHRPSQGRSFTHFDLVVISPLTRTLETANHIFGPPRPPGVPSFLAERFGERNLPRPKFLVREECRERWGLYTCDGRRPITDIIREFPDFDFSEVENNEDHFWEADRGMHMA
jgi:broad specificity phosphatase PhoE